MHERSTRSVPARPGLRALAASIAALLTLASASLAAAPPARQKAAVAAHVYLLVDGGGPGPEWTLAGPESAELVRLLEGLRSTTPSTPAGESGYKGLVVELEEPASGALREVRIFKGVVLVEEVSPDGFLLDAIDAGSAQSAGADDDGDDDDDVGEDDGASYLLDPNRRVERWLLEQGRAHMTAAQFDTIQRRLPPSR